MIFGCMGAEIVKEVVELTMHEDQPVEETRQEDRFSLLRKLSGLVRHEIKAASEACNVAASATNKPLVSQDPRA